MQPGAGGEVSLAPPIELCVVPVVLVSTPTTRTSPAGMPFAFTVTEPAEPPMPTVVWTGRWPVTGTTGGRSDGRLGQPGSTGTTTTRSPSLCSAPLAPEIPAALL